MIAIAIELKKYHQLLTSPNSKKRLMNSEKADWEKLPEIKKPFAKKSVNALRCLTKLNLARVFNHPNIIKVKNLLSILNPCSTQWQLSQSLLPPQASLRKTLLTYMKMIGSISNTWCWRTRTSTAPNLCNFWITTRLLMSAARGQSRR